MATGTDILFKEPNPAGSRQRDQIGLRGPIQYDVLYERANLGPTEGRDGRLRGEKEFEFQKNFESAILIRENASDGEAQHEQLGDVVHGVLLKRGELGHVVLTLPLNNFTGRPLVR